MIKSSIFLFFKTGGSLHIKEYLELSQWIKNIKIKLSPPYKRRGSEALTNLYKLFLLSLLR